MSDRPIYPDGSVIMDEHVTAEHVADLTARIAELEARLEIDHAYRLTEDGTTERIPAPEGMPDGIECRDATIGLLEERIAELEAEVARLRGGWASAQTENASLRELVRHAYNEGFREGMKETRNGGNSWQDSTTFKRLGALNYALAAPDTGGAADGE